MQTLQSNFDKLAQALNVSQENLAMRDAELAALLAENKNLSAQVVDFEMLLNKSQVSMFTLSHFRKFINLVKRVIDTGNYENDTFKIVYIAIITVS